MISKYVRWEWLVWSVLGVASVASAQEGQPAQESTSSAVAAPGQSESGPASEEVGAAPDPLQDEGHEDAQTDGESAAAQAGAQADSSSAQGQSVTALARRHFANGVALHREGDMVAAMVEFKRAYELAPHYKLKFNLGQTALALQDYPYAIEHLSEYLEEGGAEVPPQRRVLVEEMIRGLNDRLGYVIVQSNQEGAEIYVDDRMLGVTPLRDPLPVGIGRRRVVAIKDGYMSVERRVTLAAREQVTVSLNFQEIPELQTVEVTRVVEKGISPVVWLGVGTGILAVTATTLAVLTNMAEQDYRSELEQQTTESRLLKLKDRTESRALFTDLALGATAVGAAATLGYLLVSPDEASETPSSTGATARSVAPDWSPTFALGLEHLELGVTGHL